MKKEDKGQESSSSSGSNNHQVLIAKSCENNIGGDPLESESV